MLSALIADATPLDLRLLGRMLIHAAAVGVAVGAVVCLFYAALELFEELCLERLAGYISLRAPGEIRERPEQAAPFRPWLLILLPALGAGLASWLGRRIAPECEGAGGNAMIDAFHQRRSSVRRRVIAMKPLTTLLTLGTGGAGGREGPMMQFGGAIGSTVAHYLGASQRERRILLVAGVAAGTSAMFRTPLGAALLAVEILYRDDFEAEALIPAVLASVVGYSVFISVFSDITLFATEAKYPFSPAHLPLYALLALLLSAVGTGFVRILRAVEQLSRKLPPWSRSAAGGLALGVMATLIVTTMTEGQGMGILGGGYGAAQVAITGAPWLPDGLRGAQLLLLLCAAKALAASFTIGTGGSAGAFAPVLTVGALFGGAFGRLLQLFLDSPNLKPGAFALVGMGALFGGVAHTPLGALVMVCEMAGSYDLLVPLMLAQGITFVLLRKQSLYPAQRKTTHESPAHPERVLDVLKDVKVEDTITKRGRQIVSFELGTPVARLIHDVAETSWQDVFPVLDKSGKLAGMITPRMLRLLAAERDVESWALAVDAMQPPVTVQGSDDLRVASERMLVHGLHELIVVDAEQHIIGIIDEAEINQTYLDATCKPPPDSSLPR